MKGWQINEAYDLVQVKRNETASLDKEVKVKITKAMISPDDITMYNGDNKISEPIIPCRSAIGIVVEAGENIYGVEAKTRVYLDPISSCGNCYSCTIGQPKDCFKFNIAGKNVDGFLKDFAVVPAEKVYQLPKSVSDTEALFIGYLSLAISVIDKLQIQKGEHVAVIGGNIIGNIIAQLLIYYQGVPMLIDDNESNLEIAKRSGIYYTLKADGRLEREVSELTGGRMTPKVVYVTSCGINTEMALKIARPNATVAFVGFNYFNTRINFSQAMNKQLRFYCITNGYGNAEASINLIANNAVNLSTFNLMKATSAEIPNVFKICDERMKSAQEVYNYVIDMF